MGGVLALNTLGTTVSTVSTSWYGGGGYLLVRGGGYQQFPVESAMAEGCCVVVFKFGAGSVGARIEDRML